MKRRFSGNYITGMTIAALIFFAGCEQGEGYGGTARITGKVVTQYYNDDYSSIIREAPAVDEEVFLLFGNDEHVGDKVETSASGSFQFEFLYPGEYTLYFSSRDTSFKGDLESVATTELQLEAGADLDLGTLYRIETLDFDDGSAKIYGVVRLTNYKNSSEWPFLEVKDVSFATEHEVYLRYGDHDFYDERVRTDYNGYFEFKNLIPGDYEVYTYSEDVEGGTQDKVVPRNVTITSDNEEIDLGILDIEQL